MGCDRAFYVLSLRACRYQSVPYVRLDHCLSTEVIRVRKSADKSGLVMVTGIY